MGSTVVTTRTPAMTAEAASAPATPRGRSRRRRAASTSTGHTLSHVPVAARAPLASGRAARSTAATANAVGTTSKRASSRGPTIRGRRAQSRVPAGEPGPSGLMGEHGHDGRVEAQEQGHEAQPLPGQPRPDHEHRARQRRVLPHVVGREPPVLQGFGHPGGVDRQVIDLLRPGDEPDDDPDQRQAQDQPDRPVGPRPARAGAGHVRSAASRDARRPGLPGCAR